MLRSTIRHINEVVKQENLYFGNNQIYQESVKKILEQAEANNQSLEEYSQQHLMSPIVQTLLKEDLLNFVTDDVTNSYSYTLNQYGMLLSYDLISYNSLKTLTGTIQVSYNEIL